SQWHKQIKWEPLTEEALSPGLREAARRQNPLDRALWESWHGAGFDTAAVQPRPLQAESPGGFLTHEATRPFFLLTRWARRGGGLPRRGWPGSGEYGHAPATGPRLEAPGPDRSGRGRVSERRGARSAAGFRDRGARDARLDAVADRRGAGSRARAVGKGRSQR